MRIYSQQKLIAQLQHSYLRPSAFQYGVWRHKVFLNGTRSSGLLYVIPLPRRMLMVKTSHKPIMTSSSPRAHATAAEASVCFIWEVARTAFLSLKTQLFAFIKREEYEQRDHVTIGDAHVGTYCCLPPPIDSCFAVGARRPSRIPLQLKQYYEINSGRVSD